MKSAIRGHLSGALVALLGALVFCDCANADPGVLPVPETATTTAGNFYMSLGGFGAGFTLPKFNHYQFASTGSDLFARSPIIGGGGVGASLGYVADGLPEWLGDRPRVELVASGFQGSGTETRGVAGNFRVRVTSINGATSFVGTFIRTTYTARLDSTYSGFEIGPRLKVDEHVSTNVTLTPSIAGLIGYGFTKDDLQFNQQVTGGFLPGYVREKITTWRSGPEVGLDATWHASERWAWHAGVTSAAFFQHAGLHGTDCATNVPLTSATQACDGSTFSTNVSQNRGDIGARFGQSFGATYSTGSIKISAMVISSWTQNVAGVENPNNAGQVANIRFSDSWVYGGFVALTVPLE